LAVAEGDRAGLVEQQHVDVPCRLDRPTGHGDHVGLDHSIHAGDADRGQQSADRRRDQADEQGRERRDSDDCSLTGFVHGEDGEGQQGDGREQEDDGERCEQNAEGDLVRVFWRFAPSTMEIMRSRKVSPGRW
jgi:hypothetical protein